MNKPNSLYIHIPFCENICDYCDFPKLQYFTNFATKYLIKLKEELDSYHINHPLKTIYIGGGTPTSLEYVLLEELLKIIQPYASNVIEYTFETNPETLDIDKLRLLKQYGVNRLSIGVESTNDQILKAINRHHTFLDVINAVNMAHEVGIDNINVDLILGLPNASEKQLEKDLDNLLSLPIKHISTYSLTVHPHTVFYIKGINPLDSDIERNLYDIVENKLINNGFIHYEVSNFAKDGYQSKHNFTYWKDERYYGIGLGAAGYIDNYRYTNTRSITDYLSGITIVNKEIVTKKDDIEYYLMLNLRTNEGIDLSDFKKRFSIDIYEEKKEIFDNFIKEGLLIYQKEKNIIYPTYEGMMILDKILLDLL